MGILRVALLQIDACGFDQAANLAKGLHYCRQAKAMGADIALFPEMWNIGYQFFDADHNGAYEKWLGQAVGTDHESIVAYRQLAMELDMAVAATYLEKTGGAPRNTVSVIDRHGEIRLTYAKVHTCDFDKEASLAPGDAFYTCVLDTRIGPVKIGAMICYDREFPESARVLMLQGAEIILVPNACEVTALRLAQLKTRSFENMVGVAMANYPAPHCNGRSVAYDAEAYGTVDGPERDISVVEAGDEEAIVVADFDLDRLRAYRGRETWGNAYRKPIAYAMITSCDVQTPFVRSGDRR
jgi:predicted amidohydrolase